MEGTSAFWDKIRKELIVVFWKDGAFFRVWSKNLALTWNKVDIFSFDVILIRNVAYV
jgi:hypothetical protein